MVALKVRAADDAGITPLLCVGEEQRGPETAWNTPAAAGATPPTSCTDRSRPRSAATGTSPRRLVIAYEPVWAIGAAEPAAAEHVSDVVRRLRELLACAGLQELSGHLWRFGANPACCPRSNGVSGLFLGRFAHDAANFGKVLDEALSLSDAAGS